MTRPNGLVALTAGTLLALSPGMVRSAEAREPLPPAPGTVAVSTLAYIGAWQVIVNRTENYYVVFQIANPEVNPLFAELNVTGIMFSSDSTRQYRGTLQGTVIRATRTLQFSFTQPGSNRGGTGQLNLSLEGNSFGGTSNSGGVYMTWRGSRTK